MGVVYSAEDTKLGRRVALKFLPEELSQDALALERLQREARAASALNHPNICTIHDVDHGVLSGGSEAIHFMVMEYLEGRTLKQVVEAGPLGIMEIVELGIQIADGLDTAHAKGILHRDVKPANLFVTSRGQAKILDFGLAKLAPRWQGGDGGGTETTAERLLTSPGAAVGTVSYMSPEQARGEELDSRTDIFSLGAVLYEMATGHPAFPGSTSAVIFDAVLNREPEPIASRNPRVPEGLQRIVAKALEKDRELRYQTAAEVRTDLKRLKRELESGRSVVRSEAIDLPVKRNPRARLWLAVSALVLASFAAFTYWFSTSRAPSLPRLRQISRWNKTMESAVLSPDGRTVAFSSNASSVLQVFLMLTSGGEPLQLTRDGGDKIVDSFSPDGTEIYYSRISGISEEWVVPTLGGSPRRLAPGIGVIPSRDGTTFFYAKRGRNVLFQSSSSGLNEEEIYRFEDYLDFYLLYPDQKHLLAGTRPAGSRGIRLQKINRVDHTAEDLGTVDFQWMPEWGSPGKSLLVSRTVENLTNIWRYDLGRRTFTQVTSGPGPDLFPMADPSGNGMYFVSGKTSGRLMAYNAKTGASHEVLNEWASQPVVSPDGKRVMFKTSAQPGTDVLWVSDVDGKNLLKLASSRLLVTGEWSPDGSEVSYVDQSAGDDKVFTVGVDGTGLRQISVLQDSVIWLVWSPEGPHYASTLQDTWRIKPSEGSVERIVEGCAIMSDYVPGGKFLVGFSFVGESVGIYGVSLQDKRCLPLQLGTEAQPVRSSPDGRSLLYAVRGELETVVYRVSWSEGKVGKPEVAARLPFVLNPYVGGAGYDFSRDLSVFVFSRPSDQAELFYLQEAR
jgi:serine/threonine protein kinase